MNIVLKNKSELKPKKFKVLQSMNSESVMKVIPEHPKVTKNLNPRETKVFYYIPLANQNLKRERHSKSVVNF